MKFSLCGSCAVPRSTHGCSHSVSLVNPLISIRFRQTVMVSLICVFGLSGCAGHYKFSDHEYRPLGEPHVVNRGT